MSSLKIFEYAVVKQPLEDENGKETEPGAETSGSPVIAKKQSRTASWYRTGKPSSHSERRSGLSCRRRGSGNSPP